MVVVRALRAAGLREGEKRGLEEERAGEWFWPGRQALARMFLFSPSPLLLPVQGGNPYTAGDGEQDLYRRLGGEVYVSTCVGGRVCDWAHFFFPTSSVATAMSLSLREAAPRATTGPWGWPVRKQRTPQLWVWKGEKPGPERRFRVSVVTAQ